MDITCLACGSIVSPRIGYSRIIVCPSCRMSILLDDDSLKKAGQMPVLDEALYILRLNMRFNFEKESFTTLGRVRYYYPKGFWDKWWVVDDGGSEFWIRVDGDDIAVEHILKSPSGIPDFSEVQIGQELTIGKDLLTVMDKDICRCAGAEGEMLFTVKPGETLNYLYLTSAFDTIYTIQYFTDLTRVFKGRSIGPFDIEEA